jgi:hypothetical protein
MLFTCLREGGAGVGGGIESPSSNPNCRLNLNNMMNGSLYGGSGGSDDGTTPTGASGGGVNGSSSSSSSIPPSSGGTGYSVKCETSPPAGSTVVNGGSSAPSSGGGGPLHIPAKRLGSSSSTTPSSNNTSSCSLGGYAAAAAGMTNHNLNSSLDFTNSHASPAETVIRHSSHQAAWSAYGESSAGGPLNGGTGGGASSFEPTPYNTPMSHHGVYAYAAAVDNSRRAEESRKHGLPFWPNDYPKYGGGPGGVGVDCQSFGPQSWCPSAYGYPGRVGSHMTDSHGQPVSYLTSAASLAAAADERRSSAAAEAHSAAAAAASFHHDSYGLRNAYGSADPMSATPYPPPGQY